MGNICGALNSQFAHGVEPHVFALRSDVLPRAALVIGAVDDLVVDVCDVRDKAHLKPRIREVSAQDVVHQGGSAVAQVGRAVHGGAAQINTDLARVPHGEGFHALRGGVIEVQHSDKPTI